MKVILCAVNSQYIHSNPAIYSLARATEALEQPPVLLLREYSLNLPYETVLRELYNEAPDILAFSAYIWNIGYIERLLADLGQMLPRTTLLLGGPEATPRAAELLRRCPNLHGVLLGEGEQIWPVLLQRLMQGESCPQLPGMLWRGDEDRTTGRHAPRRAGCLNIDAGVAGGVTPCCVNTDTDADAEDYAPVPDLGELPFPYSAADLAALASARKIIYYESSRGCPYSCSFCASANAALRERPLDMVLAELPLLAAAGGQIKFVDRTFNAAPKRALAITGAVLELYRPGLSWHFEISPYALPAELLVLWQQAPPGYLRLEAGVQSLHQPSLAAIRRGGDWPRARQAIREILAHDNAHLHLDLIAGLPEETPQTFAAAFDELHMLNPHYLQLGFLKILPGSPLSAEAEQRGLLYSPYPPYQILQTPTMSAAFLLHLHRADKALNSFYNSGRFRQTLGFAAGLWPGGALEMYLRLALAMEQAGPGSLSLATKARLLADLLLPLDELLFSDLLRLDLLSYQDNQPLPVFLRRGDDNKNSFIFNYSWAFDEAGQAQKSAGPSALRFDWQNRIGATSRAGCYGV